jgi:hypothetical protein
MKNIIEKNPASVVGIAYLTLIITILLLSSCGTTQYNVGTGRPMSKQCQGAWTGGQ